MGSTSKIYYPCPNLPVLKSSDRFLRLLVSESHNLIHQFQILINESWKLIHQSEILVGESYNLIDHSQILINKY
ncbi:hypothetical protein [Chlorogloeopsis sp. ULAP02]|uniref:hypothetical protein n=1 Tax=Chlorogloeopsis sp. ULAP02 TaxID=3107926 RepID=UPI003134BF7D